jgi:hypothetical protein
MFSAWCKKKAGKELSHAEPRGSQRKEQYFENKEPAQQLGQFNFSDNLPKKTMRSSANTAVFNASLKR